MSLRRFDGWEPAEVHEHEYVDGLLVRTVVTREAEWDEDERAWMLGLAMREAAECNRCGGVLSETTDYGFKWVPEPPTVCFRCVALRADEESHGKSPYRGALIHHVHKAVRPTPKNRKRKKG